MNAARLRELLAGYQAVLSERHLVPGKQTPHLLRRVQGSPTFFDNAALPEFETRVCRSLGAGRSD